MAQSSQSKPEKHLVLEGQLRECYGRVVYSHKTHEKCADILLRRHMFLKNAKIFLSALTTCGILSTLFGSGDVGVVVAGVVSTLLLILNAYTKNYDLGEIAQKHKNAAANLWLIREKYLSLLTDLSIDNRSLKPLQEQRDILLDELSKAYMGSPTTILKAYKVAQAALQVREDMTFSDAEIDAFLPTELHRAN